MAYTEVKNAHPNVVSIGDGLRWEPMGCAGSRDNPPTVPRRRSSTRACRTRRERARSPPELIYMAKGLFQRAPTSDQQRGPCQ